MSSFIYSNSYHIKEWFDLTPTVGIATAVSSDHRAEQISHKQYLVVQIQNSEIVKNGTAKC
jgi:hypothetical protein